MRAIGSDVERTELFLNGGLSAEDLVRNDGTLFTLEELGAFDEAA